MNGIQRVAKDRRYNALASINSVLDLMSKDIQEKDIMTQVNRALEAVRTSTTLETNNYYKDVLSSIDFLLNETLSLLQSFTFATHKNDHDFQKIQTFPVERDIEPGDYSPPVGFSGEIVAPNETFNLSELFFNENVIATLRDSIATSEKLSNLLENLAVLAGKERVALYPPRSFLLYGPPGTGKTSLIRAIAQEAQRPLLSLTASDIFSKWQGESERVVREIFKYIKQNSNCIFFLDEVDALFQKRGSVVESESSRYVKTEFLVRIQDALVRRESYSNFVFIAATNLPWDLDPAFKRRFESMIYVALPDVSSRYKFWLSWVWLFEEDAELNVENNERGVNTNRNCSEVTMSQSNINSLDFLVRITEGYSISDLQSILRNTILVNARELLTHSWFFCNEHGHWLPCSPQHPAALHKNFSDLPKGTVFPSFIKLNNFLETLQQNPPTISKKDLDQYEQWKVSR